MRKAIQYTFNDYFIPINEVCQVKLVNCNGYALYCDKNVWYGYTAGATSGLLYGGNVNYFFGNKNEITNTTLYVFNPLVNPVLGITQTQYAKITIIAKQFI
jgi:hypothetical protein